MGGPCNVNVVDSVRERGGRGRISSKWKWMFSVLQRCCILKDLLDVCLKVRREGVRCHKKSARQPRMLTCQRLNHLFIFLDFSVLICKGVAGAGSS